MQTNVIQPSFCPLAFFFLSLLPQRKERGKKSYSKISRVQLFPPPLSADPKCLSPSLASSLLSLLSVSRFLITFFLPLVSVYSSSLSLFQSPSNTPPFTSPLLFLPALSLSLWEISLKHVVTSTCPQGWKISPGHLSNLFGKLFQASLPSLYPLPHHLTSISPSPLTIWFMTYQKNRLSILPGLKHCIRKRNAD